MLQLYSKGCEHVLRVLAHVSEADCQEGFSVKSVCEKARTPESFTRKIFQNLVKNKFLKAKRGPGGGYVFCRAPGEISVLQLVQAVDGKNVFKKCVLGRPQCNNQHPCSIHSSWEKARTLFISELKSTPMNHIIYQQGRKK